MFLLPLVQSFDLRLLYSSVLTNITAVGMMNDSHIYFRLFSFLRCRIFPSCRFVHISKVNLSQFLYQVCLLSYFKGWGGGIARIFFLAFPLFDQCFQMLAGRNTASEYFKLEWFYLLWRKMKKSTWCFTAQDSQWTERISKKRWVAARAGRT